MSASRKSRRDLLALGAAIWLTPISSAVAQLIGRRRLRLIPREAHPWARFMPGAWRLVETETVVFKDDKAHEKTLSATLTSILNRDESSCCLEIDTKALVSGADVSAPREVVLPIDPEGDSEVQLIKNAELTIGGQTRKVEVRQAKLTDKTSEKLMVVHVEPNAMPSVLKRETTIVDVKRREPASVTKTEVTALDVPRLVAREVRRTWQVRTTHEHPTGRIETTEYLCAEVPGEMVFQESEEFDSAGHRIRRSTVELKEFGKDNDGRRRLFGRRETNRDRRGL